VFILWQHHHPIARKFFRRPPGTIYYAKQTRKELLRPLIGERERHRLIRLLKRFRRVNPDEKMTTAFSVLLARYPYLRSHLGDAIIAATAWAKELILVTANVRHFAPIRNIRVARFPDDFSG
jgi:predicted nucleic acid-binding protein